MSEVGLFDAGQGRAEQGAQEVIHEPTRWVLELTGLDWTGTRLD